MHPVFQAPFSVQFIYLLHFFVLGALHWLGPGANCPPLPPPSRRAWVKSVLIRVEIIHVLKFKPETVEKNSLPTVSHPESKLRLSMSVQRSDHWATEVADNSKRVIYVCVRYVPMISTRMDDSPFGQFPLWTNF